ncbi:MAG TPA: zinc ribbon domain-containing protein [Thermoplasmata archaeon]|nr:zinc ribbon domain-containing protein [Thermoplasmata archaeon]
MASRTTFFAVAAVVVATVMVASGLVVLLEPNGAHPAGPGAAPAVAPVRPAAPTPAVTHGDLVVPSGETYTITSLPGEHVYYQGGNITVESGGTLDIVNVTLSFVSFIAPTGTPAERLSHIYHFTDNGTVTATNSTITTDMYVLNAYPKLNLTIQSDVPASPAEMTLWNSSIQFPGWVNIKGDAATLVLNSSSITRNPSVANFSQPEVLEGDEDFAPSIVASAGGTLNLFNSSVSALYGDNFSANNTPRPTGLGLGNITLSGPATLTNLVTPTDSANLTRDWLYPMGVSGGEIAVSYNDTAGVPTNVSFTVVYNGVDYPLPVAAELRNDSTGTATAAFPASLVSAINSLGLMDYLNFTGDFGVTPSKIAIEVTAVAGPQVNKTQVYFELNPPVSNDIQATGTNTHVSLANSALDLTFTSLPTSNLSTKAPFPWLSHKLVLTDGANASLANLSVTNPVPGFPLTNVFETSAILTDSSSVAFLYRWASVNVSGRGGFLNVKGATLSAVSSLASNETSSGIANAANNLKTWDFAIWGYVQYWDALQGYPKYGTSGLAGEASLLLASNYLTQSSLPDGYYLGGYTITLKIPIANDNTTTLPFNVRAYPEGVAWATPGYNASDYMPAQQFSSYFADVDVASVVLQAGGVNSTTVRIGQTLALNVTLNDSGTAQVFNIAAFLYYSETIYNTTPAKFLDAANDTVDLTTPGSTYTVPLQWAVNESVTGDNGRMFSHSFFLLVVWNYGQLKYGGGSDPSSLPTTIDASTVTLSAVTSTLVPPNVNLNTIYSVSGKVHYNGTNNATLLVYAYPTNGGAALIIGTSATTQGPGSFSFSLRNLTPYLTPGDKYAIELVAIYNGVQTTPFLFGTFAVPSTTTHTNLLTEKILGLPLWIWLVIAAAIVAGVLAFLYVSRRSAAGKLVECGECGNLVPESATTCPKCGAEFESDLVRCSRCASTIPANSQFCPECAAQLLGKPGEGGLDPERQGYADFTERFRAEAKKELGDNYTEGSFWDWWKRQPTYVPFSQWKLQQEQGTPRPGMMAPPAATTSRPDTPAPAAAPPAKGTPPPPKRPPSGGAAAAPPAPPAATAPPAAAAPAGAAPAAGLRACPNCQKEIPTEYLVCPFCGSVTQ